MDPSTAGDDSWLARAPEDRARSQAAQMVTLRAFEPPVPALVGLAVPATHAGDRIPEAHLLPVRPAGRLVGKLRLKLRQGLRKLAPQLLKVRSRQGTSLSQSAACIVRRSEADRHDTRRHKVSALQLRSRFFPDILHYRLRL